MIKQKEVLFRSDVVVGGTVGAGGAGVAVMVEPLRDSTTPGAGSYRPGAFPVRVRFDGDPARELVMTAATPRTISGGFKKLELVEDRADQAGHGYLVSYAETAADILEAGQGLAVYRDNNQGTIPMALSCYLFQGIITPEARAESGVPSMAENEDEHPRRLQVFDTGELRVRDDGTGNGTLLDKNYWTAPQLFDGSRWLVPYVLIDDPAEARGIDVSRFTAFEVTVAGGATPRTAAPSSLRVFAEIVTGPEEQAPVLEVVELAPTGNLLSSTAVGACHMGAGVAHYTSSTFTSRGWRPGWVRVRVDMQNIGTCQMRVLLTGRR
jgi:hypothetical protein